VSFIICDYYNNRCYYCLVELLIIIVIGRINVCLYTSVCYYVVVVCECVL